MVPQEPIEVDQAHSRVTAQRRRDAREYKTDIQNTIMLSEWMFRRKDEPSLAAHSTSIKSIVRSEIEIRNCPPARGTIRPCRGFQDSRIRGSPRKRVVDDPSSGPPKFNQLRCHRSGRCSVRRSGPQDQRRNDGWAQQARLSQAGDESPAEIKGHRCPESLAQRRRNQQRQQAVGGRRVAVVTIGQAGADHR